MKRWQYVLSYFVIGLGIYGASCWVAHTHDVRSPPHDPFWAKTVLIGAMSIVSISAILLSTFAIKPPKAHWPITEGLFAGALLLYIFGPNSIQRLLGQLMDNKYGLFSCYVLNVVFFATSIQSTIGAIRISQILKGVTGIPVVIALGTLTFMGIWAFLFFE